MADFFFQPAETQLADLSTCLSVCGFPLATGGPKGAALFARREIITEEPLVSY